MVPSQVSHKPSLPAEWELLDEVAHMGARYRRTTDGLRVISAIIDFGRFKWYHVSLCFGEGRMPSDADVHAIRNLFVPPDCNSVAGMMPGAPPSVNPWNVHVWASLPGEPKVPFGKPIHSIQNN